MHKISSEISTKMNLKNFGGGYNEPSSQMTCAHFVIYSLLNPYGLRFLMGLAAKRGAFYRQEKRFRNAHETVGETWSSGSFTAIASYSRSPVLDVCCVLCQVTVGPSTDATCRYLDSCLSRHDGSIFRGGFIYCTLLQLWIGRSIRFMVISGSWLRRDVEFTITGIISTWCGGRLEFLSYRPFFSAKLKKTNS